MLAFSLDNMPSNFFNLILLLSIQFFQISLGHAIPKPSSCLLKERNALLKFKSGLNDPSDLLSSWAGPDCCRWLGVVCNNTTKHVIALDLHVITLEGEIDPSLPTLEGEIDPSLEGEIDPSLPTLEGEIDPSLASLVHLQHLDLTTQYYSNLTLVDPPWLHHLVSLQHINLSFVNLQDSPTILPSLLSLPSISAITLRGCQMTSPPQSIPPSNLSSLYLLDISENFFSNSTTIPDWISNLTGLRILNLKSNYLSGSIPPSLGKLKSLKEVDLSYNLLSGSIPLSLTKLASLKLLDLSSNSLSGSIPLSLTKLASLKLLDLSSNSLSGSIPLSLTKLASLKLLDLSYNSLSGVIPTQLFSLPNIEELSLDDNHDLNGKIPDNLGQLKTLKKLSLGGKLSLEGLSGVISEAHFLNLTLLKELTISSTKSLAMRFSYGWVPPFRLVRLVIKGCNMGPGFPNWIQTQDMLDTLNLVDAGLFGRIPSWIWNFSAVSDLDLSLNQLEGSVTIPLNMMTSLVHLNISGNNFFGKFELKGGPCGLSFVYLSKNNFSGRFPLSLQNCSQMFDLDLGWNKFSGSLPAWIVHSFPRLSFLSLRSNRISGRLLTLSALVLDLAGNYLSGTIPEGLLCGANLSGANIGGLKCPCSLYSLHLENNYLSGVLPSFMRSCSDMDVLDLGYNMLEGPIPSWVPEKMPSLKFLCLRSNKFSGTIPRQVWSMNNLQFLDLANNNLNGMLPERFGNFSAMKIRHNKNETLPNSYESLVVFTKGQELSFSSNLVLITSIDLSKNNLVGEIPKGIGDLLGLMNLNLSENSLSGRIPDSISRLQEMETLDLSMNNFTGEIPQGMSKMTLLSHLNLSFNGLVGEIPVGGQLFTFSDKSFMGNLGLCGIPLASCERKKSTDGSNVNDNWDKHEKLLLYAFTTLGFILGFWSVCGAILFKARWRYAYFKFIDNMRDDVYVAFVVKIKPRVKRLFNMK